MKLYDIDNQICTPITEKAMVYLHKKYPPKQCPDMYDIDGDLCVGEDLHIEIEVDLIFSGLLGLRSKKH